MKNSTRRQFLRGAAGFTLALPFLASLEPKKARAGIGPNGSRPRFVCMTTQHGGVWGANMFPNPAMAATSRTIYPGHAMHQGALSLSVSGGVASLSPVLSAASDRLTSGIASKMNVLRGIDIPFYIGHHTGGDLGNYARNDGESENPMEYRPTIDQVLAYSPSFYDDTSSLRKRSMHVGTHTGHSWGYANPTQGSGAIEAIPLSQSAMTLFEEIFVPDAEPDARPLVVDRVHESYRRLRDGAFGDARRLGSADRQRLDDHMDRLRDLETRLNAVASCGDVAPPASDTNGLDVGGYSSDVAAMRAYYQLYNDVIAAAFLCGTSRIAVINSGETWSTQYPGLCCDWHQLVAHESSQPDGVAQQIMVAAKRDFFESVFLDLVRKLDVEETDGQTYLDNTLLMWTQESGSTTHDPISLPIITAGSAAGYLRTGQYLDYRNRNNTTLAHDYMPEYQLHRPGLTHGRFLATVLQAMGLSPAEFERPGERGYGVPLVDNETAWPSNYLADASEPLPEFTVG